MKKENNKVVILCDRNPYTSFGRLTLDIQKAISSEFDAHVLWLTTLKDLRCKKQIDGKSFHWICSFNFISGWWLFRKPVKKYLKKLQPQKIILIDPVMGYLIPEIKKTLPDSKVVVFVHDMFPKTLHEKSIKHRLGSKYFILPIKNADGFIYNSEYTRNEAYRVLGLDRNGPIVGCSIDQSSFHLPQKSKADIKKQFDFRDYKFVCMNISLDEPRKNIATFFEIAKARPNVAFVRVGPYSKWMKKWILENKTENIFHFTGIKFKALLDIYACADLFIYPSFFEGFGLPPLEALACGVPAVSAATSALKENLDGVIPLVYPADNVDGYIDIVDKVISGKNVVNRDAAKELLTKFSLENFGLRVIKFLQEL